LGGLGESFQNYNECARYVRRPGLGRSFQNYNQRARFVRRPGLDKYLAEFENVITAGHVFRSWQEIADLQTGTTSIWSYKGQ
jgi:hypothetical protein